MAANVDLPSGVTQEAGEESPTTTPTPETTEVSSAPGNEEELSPTEETAQEEQVTLSTPSPGEQVQIAIVPGLKIYADFDLQSQELTATDADLIIEFDNGAVITLTDFALYAAGDMPPMMVLSDGSLVSGDTLVFSYTGTEIEPAAGPTLTSGGSGEYRDDLGDLIGGLDRLGGQDPDPFGGGIVTPAEDEEFNLAPDAVDDLVATDEDTAITIPVLVNDSDPDNDPLTITDFNLAPDFNGNLVSNGDGTFTYTPTQDFIGSDSFTYTVTDGNGNFDTATVTINVGPINDPPIAADDLAKTNEDTPVTIAVLPNDKDPDGDPLTISDFPQESAEGGKVDLNEDGTFTYTPALNFNGEDSFTYTVDDGNGGTDTATVTIDVKPINDPPIAVDDTVTTDEDTPIAIQVLANDTDPDNDPLTVTGFTLAPDFIGNLVRNEDGTFSFNPDGDFNGSVTFTYTISDGNGGTDTATVTINVNPVPDPPVALDDLATTEEETPVTIAVLDNDSDPDDDTLTITDFTQTSNGTLVLNVDGTFTYTPNEDFVGADSFTYTISDGNGGTDTAEVDLTVTSVNDLPTATDHIGSVNTAFLVATKTVNNSPFDSAVLEKDDPNAYTEEFTMPFKVTDMAYNNEGKLFGARNDGAVFLMNPLADDPPTVDEDGNVDGLQDLEFQFFLPSETGTNVNGIAFDDTTGRNLLYVLNGSTLYVVEYDVNFNPEAIDANGTATLIGSVDGLDIGINNPIDLVAFVDGKLYAISKSGSEGEVYEIQIETDSTSPNFGLAIDSDFLGNVDLSALTNPYGMVAGFNVVPVIYVVGSTGSSGSVLFFDPAELGEETLVPDTAFTVDDVGGGTFEALAGEVNPLLHITGLVTDFLKGDSDPDSNPAGFTVTQINGTDLDLPDLNDEISFDGRFGTLTIKNVGGELEYTYELTDTDPEPDGVPDNNTPGYEIFTYTMDDGDGGTDTANVIFSVNNNFSGQLLRGTDGNDTLATLTGDFGNDLLIGGLGDDIMSGGAGEDDGIDTFLFAGGEGNNTVTDFNIAEGDILRLTDVLDVNTDLTIDGLDIGVTVDGENVTLHINEGTPQATDVTLAGINDLGQFTGATNLADPVMADLMQQVDFNDDGGL